MNISEVLIRQKNELNYIYSQELLDREYHIDINTDIIKVITGIRRSGKSTLALLSLKDKNFGYVNFDERELINFNSTDIEKGIKEIYGDTNILFLDEIQNYDKWELWVNSLYRRGYNITITGSNSKLLSKELSTHLTGRYVSIEIFPFSFKEILNYKKINLKDIEIDKEKKGKILNILRNYLDTGGFPEVIVKNFGKDYIKTLFDSIIYKDVLYRYKIRNIEKLHDLARYLIFISSNRFTINKLYNILNFNSKVTVERYIEYLKEAYLIFTLRYFSYKEKERVKYPKKIYIIDNGFITALSDNYSISRLMENTVFIELYKKYKENFYYLYGNNYEIDFLIKEGNNIKQLIQVSYINNYDEIDKREIRSLIKGYNLFKEYNPELLIITWDYEDTKIIDNVNIKFIPLYKWLLNI